MTPPGSPISCCSCSAIAGWVIVSNRHQLGRVAQQAAIWAFIFIGAIASVGLWNDIQNQVAPRASVVGNQIVIPRGPDGHYHLTMRLNDVPVQFVIDTGASDLVLSQRDAARVGVDTRALPYVGQAITANGTVRTARVTIPSVRIGAIHQTDVPASVTEGPMQGSLLGMSFLQRFARIEIAGNRMTLQM